MFQVAWTCNLQPETRNYLLIAWQTPIFNGMTMSDLRRKIIDELSSIEDEEILREIYRMVKVESDLQPIHPLTEAERKAIDAGMKDIEEGRVFTSKEAKAQIKKWLRK